MNLYFLIVSINVVRCIELYDHGFELRDDLGGALGHKYMQKNPHVGKSSDKRCFGAKELRERFVDEDIRIPESKYVRQLCAPYFLIIGFGRCGTTSLAKYLSDHPRMSFGTRKEHLYFYRPEMCDLQHGPNNAWPKCDLGAYASQFPVLNEKRDITFDATPMLGGDMGVPASIDTMGWLQDRLPRLKLIVLVKSPADRFLSNPLATAKVSRLQVALRQQEAGGGEDKVIMPSKLLRILMDNCYIDKLGKWLQFYPPSRFFLIRSEDLRSSLARRQRILDSIADFLQIERHEYPSQVLEYVGHMKRATNQSLDPSTRTLINCLPELLKCEQRLELAVKSEHRVFRWCDDALALSQGRGAHIQVIRPTLQPPPLKLSERRKKNLLRIPESNEDSLYSIVLAIVIAVTVLLLW